MRETWQLLAAHSFLIGTLLAVGGGAGLSAQENVGTSTKKVCSCGAHPPGRPPDRVVVPYAGEPADLRPFAKFTTPYELNYVHPNVYSGAGRDLPEPRGLSEIRIGFLGPIENNPEHVFGMRMLHGAELAIEERNAQGGYGGKPFKLMLHDDYSNWQSAAVYGETRPTDPGIWGSAADEMVKMVYDDKDWAVFGSISSESTHIALRVALRAEIPIVNSASTDPTIPETYIPWYFTDLQDDRVQSYTLARRIFTELGMKRVALLRVNNRYGRFGVLKFRDASRRLGHPVVIEQKFLPGVTDFSRYLRVIQDSRAEAIVLWADEAQAATILKQMRKMGMKQRVFGSYRTLGPTLLADAGPAAEGFEAVFPYDPTRTDPRWTAFQSRYAQRFGEPPEQFAALAYDAMNQLLDSICEAGLNRARIHDALAQIGSYDGVTGHMVYDPNLKNISPMYLGRVENGVITYRLERFDRRQASVPTSAAIADPRAATLVKAYAHLPEAPVSFDGPPVPDLLPGPIRIAVFGPHAKATVRSVSVAAATAPGWELIPIDSGQSWGIAAAELVKALMDRHALAVIALDRDAAHLSTQLALKSFVPVIAITDDRTLTSTNVPWVFRLSAGTSQVAALKVLTLAEQKSGKNPERLRTVLASGQHFGDQFFASNGEPGKQVLHDSFHPR